MIVYLWAFGLASLFLARSAVLAAQHPLDGHPASPETLSSLATGGVRTLSSASHPRHRIKIRSHEGWCDPSVRSYSGFLDTGYGKELFFWFFESRHKPEQDPVVMWINGGPGSTSALGLFMEQGPCRMKANPQSVNDTYVHPYAWNERANIFFLDQPIGVGYSHADNGQTVSRTEAAALDIAAFVEIFFDTFAEYRGRPFHMSGESYGGRYLPVFASAVYDQNTRMVKQEKEPINLKSVMIGNGATSFYAMAEGTYNLMCTRHRDLGHSVLSIADCVAYAEKIPRCSKMLQRFCIDTQEPTMCAMWFDHCLETWDPESITFNPQNVNQSCTMQERNDYLCMKESLDVDAYLNLPDVRELLGVSRHVPNFTSVSWELNKNFIVSLDHAVQTYHYVANLLERGVPVLNYVGTLDSECDHFAQEIWMNEMPWTGRDGYLAAPKEDWMVDGEVAGELKTYDDLTLLKIYGAGHLVPTDKPQEALAMFNSWIEKHN